jgi:hypothetical protein
LFISFIEWNYIVNALKKNVFTRASVSCNIWQELDKKKEELERLSMLMAVSQN